MNSYQYNATPGSTTTIPGFVIVGLIIAIIVLLACWPKILEWCQKFKYRHNTIKSFIICQKSPNIDLKKLYQVVDDTNDFLRGKALKGIKIRRKKVKTKNLISITSVLGNGCYYFIIWYKSKG